MRAALLVLSLALVATPPAVLAQTALPPGARRADPPSTAQTQSARREADALIAAADARDLFENVTDDGSPRVRHRASGLECSFNSGGALNRVLLFPSGLPRGEDVGCNTESDGNSVTLYATRFVEPTTVEAQMRVAVGHIRSRFPDARPAPTQMRMEPARGAGPAIPPHQSATFLISGPNGRPMVTRVAIAIHDGWVVKQRYTATGDNTVAAELMSELMFTGMLTDLVEAGASGRRTR